MASVLLTVQEVQELIKAGTHLRDLDKRYIELQKRYDALYGLFSQLLLKVNELERSI